jgi:integrase
MQLPKVAYTKQRGKTYHLNIPIPAPIRPLYGGKATFEGTTKSSDPKEAERQVNAHRVTFDIQVKEAQRTADQARLRRLLDPADAAVVDTLGGAEKVSAMIDSLREQAAFAAGTENLTQQMSFSADGTSEVRTFAPDEELEPDVMREIQIKAEAASNLAFQATITAELRNLKRVAAKLDEHVNDAPEWLDEGVTGIRDLAEKMASDRGYGRENLLKLRYTVRRWIEWHGDLPLADLTRKHLSSFADGLKGLPITRKKEVMDLPMRKAIEFAREAGLETMGDKTRQSRIDHMKGLTKYALDKLGEIEVDPFSGYTISKAKVKHAIAAKDKKRPYTPAQVTSVLSHCRAKFDHDTIDYWLPHIAAYTGARREEIAQLHVADVTDWNGRFTIRITDEEEDQSLKNKHSFRTVPVPTALMDLGLSQFVTRRRQAGDKMLFLEPFTINKTKQKIIREIQANGNGKYAGTYGQRYEREVTEPLGLKGMKLSLHSFRHSWTDAARRAKIDPEIRRLIAGRLDGEDSVESRYGGADLLAEKLEAMDKVAPFLTKA